MKKDNKEAVCNKQEINIWVVTTAYSDYDQHGEYFLAAYLNKPTFIQLKELINCDDVTVGKLTRGGGRQATEYQWYRLHKMKDSEEFKETRLWK